MKHRKIQIISICGISILAVLLLMSACTAPTVTVTKTVTGNATTSATTSPAETVNWQVYFSASEADASVATFIHDLEPSLTAATNGAVTFTNFVMGEHPYKDIDILKLLKEIPTAAIVEISWGKVSGDDARFAIGDIPMLFPTNQRVYYEILDSTIIPYYEDITSTNYGYIPFLSQSFMPQRVGGKDFFVSDFNSVKGKKIRVWNPQLSDYVTTIGGTPVSVSWGEVYTSLQTGLIDGAITSSGAFYEAKLFEVLNSLSCTEAQFGARSLALNQEALEALPGDLQQTVLDWTVQAQEELRTKYHAMQDMETLLGVVEYGVTIKACSPSFIEQVRAKSWEGIWKPWIERSGGMESSAATAFNDIAKVLIAAGYTVPGYTPH